MKTDPQTYINQLFTIVDTKSILIYTSEGRFKRLYCPFMVIVIKDVGDLKQGDLKPVSAVKMSLELIEIFIISGKAYHYYNFRLKII
jgi:hypothetical protein